MRVKGAKNKVTIEMERLMAEGMPQALAKVTARENLGKAPAKTKAAPAKSVSNEAGDKMKKVRKARTPKKDKVEKETTKKTSKKDTIYPPIVAGYNPTTRSAWLKATKTNSRKSAIRAMCLMCVGGSVKEVKDCTAPYCPLFKYRITG